MEYLVNDIDAEMRSIETEARKFGWVIEYASRKGFIMLSQPRLFPEVDEKLILAAVKAGFRRNCNQNCAWCSSSHPLLQVEEFSYVKLCTLIAFKIFPILEKLKQEEKQDERE